MKNNWQIKKIEEICEVFADGDWIEKKDQSTGGIRLIQTGNIGNGNFLDRGEKARYISESTFKRLRCTEVLPGDCLLSRLPDPVGRAGLIPETGQKMITAVDCTIMRFKNDTLPKWFIYYSLSLDYQNEINKEVTGATRQRISRSNLGNVKIPVPPISEQKQIVKALDVVFEKTSKAKENAEKNLQNARELFESYLQNIFANQSDGWEKKRLSEICEIRPPKNEARAKLRDEDRVSFVPMEDLGIRQKWLVPAKERTLSEVEGSYTYFADQDVLLAKITPCFENGKLGIACDLKNGIGFGSSEFVVFRTKAKLSPEFLYYYLLREEFRREGSKRMMGAVGHKRVAKEFLESSVIFVPPPAVQDRFIANLDLLSFEIKRLEGIYQQKLANLEELKKSVLHKAFNGELAGACS